MIELVWKILDDYIWAPGFFIGVCLAVYYAAKASELARRVKRLQTVNRILVEEDEKSEESRTPGGN